MASKEMITKIILKGVTDPSLTKAFQNANNLANNHIDTLKKAGDFIKKTAKIGATAVVAGVGASIKSAIDYESAFTGVMKTVDETGTTTYEDLSNSIRKLSERMPASANDIAGVAEVAGQLGIKADDIMKFTETMINLGETTNIVADEAASTIAKYFNITNTGMGDVDKFGATLVALGNNAATTEADIMNMASRIASSGSMIGLSNQEILGLATSLSSVGLQAEGGGTAISTVLSQIDKTVALNGESLSTWASLAGMSAKEFKTAWATDTMGTIQKVVSGMGDAKKGGKNLNVILEDLGIKGIRTSDTMKRLTNASDLMADMTNLANKAWDENTALTDEANKRYGTMASKIQMFKNKLTNVAITVGDKLMPVLDKITSGLDKIDWEGVGTKICNVIQWISDHSTTLMTIIGAIGGVIAGVKIAGIIKGIITVIKVISTLSKTFGIMKVVMAALGGPVTIVIAIIGALVGAFIVLWNKSDKFRNFFINLWNKIKEVVSSVGNWLKNFFTVTIPNAFNSFVEKCKSVGNSIKNFFTVTIPTAFNKVVTYFKELPSKIGAWLSGVGQKIATWGSNLWAKAKQIGLNFVNGIVNFFKQLPYKIGFVIGFVIGKIFAFGKKLLNFATVTIPQFIGKVIDWFKQLPSRIGTWLTNTIAKITAWGSRMITIGKQKVMSFINSVVTFFKTLPSRVSTWLTNTIAKITAWGSRMISIGKAKVTQFINTVINFFRTLPSKVMTWLTNTAQKVVSWGTSLASKGKAAATKLLNSVVNKIKELPGKLKALGKNIVQGLWNGINNAKDWLIGKIKSFASGITDGIKKALGIKSPSRVMRDMVGKFIPMGVGVGIQKNMGTAINAVKTMGGKITNTASKISPTIQTKVATVSEKIKAIKKGGKFPKPNKNDGNGNEPEPFILRGDAPKNRSLLMDAAKGVGNRIGGTNYSFTFAPVINGNIASEIKQVLEEEEENFKAMMDKYLREKGVLAY